MQILNTKTPGLERVGVVARTLPDARRGHEVILSHPWTSEEASYDENTPIRNRLNGTLLLWDEARDQTVVAGSGFPKTRDS